MKLFSRKALVAGAAAVALSFAGTSAAVAAEETTTTQAPGGSSTGSSTDKTTTEPTDGNKNGEDGDGSSDAKEISAWISVFTAVIGALGALFSFASKYLGFKL